MARPFLELTLAEWLETLAAPDPSPASGSAAAMTAATAAAVIALTGRLSPQAGGLVAQALRLRTRLAGLADADAVVYAASLEMLTADAAEPSEQRDFELGTALAQAAQVPLLIAEAAADVAMLATTAAEEMAPQVQPDAQAAAALAAGAAAAAARLVEVNLASTSTDERVKRARAAAERAATAARQSVQGDSVQSAR